MPIPRKLKDGRTDGRTEEQTDRPYFTGPLRPRPGVQQNYHQPQGALDVRLATQALVHKVHFDI